jgi:hypothetical protein
MHVFFDALPTVSPAFRFFPEALLATIKAMQPDTGFLVCGFGCQNEYILRLSLELQLFAVMKQLRHETVAPLDAGSTDPAILCCADAHLILNDTEIYIYREKRY